MTKKRETKEKVRKKEKRQKDRKTGIRQTNEKLTNRHIKRQKSEILSERLEKTEGQTIGKTPTNSKTDRQIVSKQASEQAR